MKKVMLSCALLISAVVASAIPYNADAWNESANLIRAGKLAEARTYIATIAPQNNSVILLRAWADYVDEAVDTSTTAKLDAIVKAHHAAAGQTGVTLKNASEAAVLWILIYGAKDAEAGLAYFNTLENPSAGCVARAVVALQLLGRKDEALNLAVSSKQWYTAFTVAKSIGSKVKTFEYGSKLILDTPQKAPIVQKVLDAIGGINFRDTTVTDEMKIVFYKDVDKQYRRFMATDATTWKPVLASVLHSLKALGIEVVE